MHPKVLKVLSRKQWAQRTEEWYKQRRQLLTASEVAGALDIKPYASYRGSPRADLLKKKLENKPFSNMFTLHGQKYEDDARDLMASVLGEEVHDVGLLVHPQHPWLGASPDGVTSSGKCIEIKCPLRRAIVPGAVPSHYMPQIQVQLQVCDLDQCIFVQYKPPHLAPDRTRVLDICVVERDDAWFSRNLPDLRAFYTEYSEAMNTYVSSPAPPTQACSIVDDMYADA